MRRASMPATIRTSDFSLSATGQRHGTQPGPHGAQVGGDEERAVLGKDADAVAGSQPFAPELSRPGVRQGAKLAVADHFLAADDGGRVGLPAGQDPLRRVGDRFVHAKRFPLPPGEGRGEGGQGFAGSPSP